VLCGAIILLSGSKSLFNLTYKSLSSVSLTYYKEKAVGVGTALTTHRGMATTVGEVHHHRR
jgi:hypothetical protein